MVETRRETLVTLQTETTPVKADEVHGAIVDIASMYAYAAREEGTLHLGNLERILATQGDLRRSTYQGQAVAFRASLEALGQSALLEFIDEQVRAELSQSQGQA